MPAFLVEFESAFGPEHRSFTLDADRPLRPQMEQVLEELRVAGRVVVGGPDDELAVYWNEAELDQARELSALGVNTSRPIKLRMRPRTKLSSRATVFD